MNDYDTKRENFKIKTLKHFSFLNEEFGFEEPNIFEFKQANGTVISDTFEYINNSYKKTIRIKNSYHPVDYGFEFSICNSILEKEQNNFQMLEFCLKEKQDVEQSFIPKMAETIRLKHIDKLR